MANKILKACFSWPALAVLCGALAFVAWPWADHWVSYFWLWMGAAVLIGELFCKIFTKRTVSQNVQAQGLVDKVRFWVHNALWILFAFTLAGHFCKKLF